MGLKGISWIEQNIEKVVAGAFGVALLGVVAMQFIGEGSTIELGMGKDKKKYGYDLVWDQVAQQARTTRAQITSMEPDAEAMGFAGGPGVLATFTGKLNGPVAPSSTLAAALDEPTLKYIPGISKDGAGAKTEMYAALKPPVAAKPIGASHLATIHPQEVIASPELAKLLGATIDPRDAAAPKLGTLLPKLDRAAISVETSYNGTAIEALLLADPDGDGPVSPIPRHWWDSGRVQILGVEMERQELKPDGEWAAPTTVAPMPGRLDLLASVKEMLGGENIPFTSIMAEASRQREQVQRPPYYTIVLGEEWIPPSEVVEDLAEAVAPGGDQVTRMKQQLTEIDTGMAKRQEQMDDLEKEIAQGQAPQPPGRQPTPPPKTGDGKGRPTTRDPKAPPPDSQPKDPKQAKLEALRKAQVRDFARRDKIVDALKKLGVDVDANAAVKEPAKPKKESVEAPLLTNNDLRIWSHDVTVERGKTYRYRMTVVLNNPIYGQSAALDKKQADLAKDPLVRTPPSEWSDPVHVDPETYYFVTGASPEDAFASTARASAEVFVFSMGYWRKGQVNLEPGDTIAAEVKVPDPEKIGAMLVLDPNQPQAPPIGPIGPGGPLPAPGPRGRPGQQQPEPRDRLPQPPPPPHPGGEPGAIDPATILIPKLVAEDALLLDVATTTVVSDQGIAKTKTENQAFLLNEDGQIVVRTPDGDRSASSYLRLVRSAERGEEALRPRAARPIERPVGPTDRPQGPLDRPGDGGGGGGGG